MDEKYIETGEATQEAMKANALAAVTAKAFSNADLTPSQYKRLDCEECEDDLPVFRMQKGFTLCTHCQTTREKGQVRRAA